MSKYIFLKDCDLFDIYFSIKKKYWVWSYKYM